MTTQHTLGKYLGTNVLTMEQQKRFLPVPGVWGVLCFFCLYVPVCAGARTTQIYLRDSCRPWVAYGDAKSARY